MAKMHEMVISLKRGFCMRDLDSTGTLTLAQHLSQIVQVERVESFPTGMTAVVHINSLELEKLRAHVGARCHIVTRTKGRVNKQKVV